MRVLTLIIMSWFALNHDSRYRGTLSTRQLDPLLQELPLKQKIVLALHFPRFFKAI